MTENIENTDDLERRLTGTLDSTARTLPESTPPSFSWQAPTVAAGHRGPRIPRRAVYAGSGLVAAAVAAAVLATTLTGGSTPGHPAAGGNATARATRSGTYTQQGAPALLLAAARTLRRDGDPTLQDGQYRYVRIVGPAPAFIEFGKDKKPHTVPAPAGSYSLDQYWIPKDQTDVWMRRSSVVGDPNSGPADVWKGRCDDLYADTQDGPQGPACTRPGSFSDPTPAFIAALPRDPDALYTRLHAYAEQNLNPDKIHDTGFEMFTLVDSLLTDGIVPSDLTSTLYGVLSRIPGIDVVDGATNYTGVAGTGFRLSTLLGQGSDALSDTQTIIVDPDSGAFLGDRDVSDGRDYSSAVTTGVADHLGDPGN